MSVKQPVKAQEQTSTGNEFGYGYDADKNDDMKTRTLPREVDITDASLKAVWADMVRGKSKSNWILLGLPDHDSNVVKVVQTGEKGLTELRDLLQEKEFSSRILWGALLVNGLSRDGAVETKRQKVIYFSFVGNVHELLKAQANVLKRQVQEVFGAVQLTVDLTHSDVDELLSDNSLGWRIVNGEGSHKSTHLDYGSGKAIPCSSFHLDSDGSGDDEEYDSD